MAQTRACQVGGETRPSRGTFLSRPDSATDQESGIPTEGSVPVCAVCGGVGSCEFCPNIPGEPPQGDAGGVPSADAVRSEAQARARSILWEAIEREDVAAAANARAEWTITLAEELALTAMVAVRDPESHSRYAARTLRRLLDEDPSLSLDEAASAASALAALGGRGHAEALSILQAMAERATERATSTACRRIAYRVAQPDVRGIDTTT